MKKKKKTALIAVLCVLAVLCGVGLWFAPQIRDVIRIAQNLTLDEETRSAQEEENRRQEEELRDKYDVPQGEVDEAINAGVMDGSLSLEEAARQWLEQNGGTDLSGVYGGSGEADAVGDASGSPEADAADGGQDASGNGDSDGNSGGETAPSGESKPQINPSGESNPQSTPSGESNPQSIPSGESNPQSTPSGESTPQSTPSGESKPQNNPSGESESQSAAQTTPKESETQTTAETPSAADAAQAEKESKVQNLIAQAQVLRSVFTARLDAVIAQSKSEFLSLPEEEQTTASKVRIVTSHLGEVTDMEAECDAQVASIVSQLQALDPAAAAAVQNQYEQEKLAKKTSLLNEYRNGSQG